MAGKNCVASVRRRVYQRDVLQLIVDDKTVAEVEEMLDRPVAVIHSIQPELRN